MTNLLSFTHNSSLVAHYFLCRAATTAKAICSKSSLSAAVASLTAATAIKNQTAIAAAVAVRELPATAPLLSFTCNL
jgi:hypothetical protein